MRTKMAFAAGFAAGYVLGARAGRERYEQISRAARSFMENPKVQQAAATAQHQAGDALNAAAHRAGDAGSRKIGEVASKLGDKLPGRGKTSTDSVGSPYATTDTGTTTNGRSGTTAW